MGYELERITGEVDEELKCGLCRQLLENPVILNQCDHIFCDQCLNKWLAKHKICPIDKQFVNKEYHVKTAPKLFQKFITKYEISCDYAINGCTKVFKVDKLVDHIRECPFRNNSSSRPEKSETQTTINDRRLDGLESRVRDLESQNYYIQQQLTDLKKQLAIEYRVLAIDHQQSPSSSSTGTTTTTTTTSTLEQSLSLSPEPSETSQESAKITVKYDDKCLVVDADPNETIEQIKHRVNQLVDFDCNDMYVLFANQELDPKLTLSDYRIYRPMPHLFLTLVKKSIKISLRINGTRNDFVEVSPKQTIANLIAMSLGKEALETKQYIAVYRNQRLDEKRSLMSYKIRDGNYIFIRTTGGQLAVNTSLTCNLN